MSSIFCVTVLWQFVMLSYVIQVSGREKCVWDSWRQGRRRRSKRGRNLHMCLSVWRSSSRFECFSLAWEKKPPKTPRTLLPGNLNCAAFSNTQPFWYSFIKASSAVCTDLWDVMRGEKCSRTAKKCNYSCFYCYYFIILLNKRQIFTWYCK